jgi:hypothetical protein
MGRPQYVVGKGSFLAKYSLEERAPLMPAEDKEEVEAKLGS